MGPSINNNQEHDLDENDVTTSSDTCSAKTYQSLLSSSTTTRDYMDYMLPKNKTYRRSIRILLQGNVCILLAILLSIWTPFDFFMNERTRMRPGLPPFEWWKKPPDEGVLNIYIFNLTNADRFLNGTDRKMKLEEVGPIVFREVWEHSDVVFNENGTMTYTVTRKAFFEPKYNSIDLASAIVMPNMPLLGSTSFAWDAPLLAKLGFQSLVNILDSKPIINTTIYNFLYNFTDPLIKLTNSYLPNLAPVNNLGVVHMMYEDFVDRVTAYIGTSRGHNVFSLIDKYNGRGTVPGHDLTCTDTIINATEAIIFNQFVSKDQELRYFRKSLCRVIPLKYNGEIKKYGIKGYKFTMPQNALDRTSPADEDCYKSDPPLLNGLSDLSQCLYSFPMAASFPHFLYGDEKLNTYVEGMRPNATKHLSYVYVEPTTGIPLESKAAIQININMRPLRNFNSIFDKFSDMIIPIFWLEYNMYKLPGYVIALIYFSLMVRYVQWIIVGILVGSGCRYIWMWRKDKTKTIISARETSTPKLDHNKIAEFEKDAFLRK